MERLEMFVDGACHGNPGECSVGVVINKDNVTIKEISRAIGPGTNNIAEYSALLIALEEAHKLKATHLKIFTDSELMYKQVTGQYQIKNENLKDLFLKVSEWTKKFTHLEIQHVLREKNKRADQLATQALKKKRVKVVAPLFQRSEEESPSSIG